MQSLDQEKQQLDQHVTILRQSRINKIVLDKHPRPIVRLGHVFVERRSFVWSNARWFAIALICAPLRFSRVRMDNLHGFSI